jgi:DNA polymerase delta subunit 1
VNNQIKKPVLRMFEHVIPNPESIFVGEHTMVRYIPKVNINSALGKFVQKKTVCMNCKKIIKDNEALCFACKDKTLEMITKTSLVVLYYYFRNYKTYK